MRTIEIKAYQFDELSEKAKEKAIECLFDINVDYDWWESTYNYIKEVFESYGFGCEIRGFDLGRSNCIDIEASANAEDVLKYAHKDNPRKIDIPDRPELNKWYLKLLGEEIEPIVYLRGKHSEDFENDLYSGYDNLEKESDKLESFCMCVARELRHFALKALKDEYEYLTSEESIINTIIANEYEFREDGKFPVC